MLVKGMPTLWVHSPVREPSKWQRGNQHLLNISFGGEAEKVVSAPEMPGMKVARDAARVGSDVKPHFSPSDTQPQAQVIMGGMDFKDVLVDGAFGIFHAPASLDLFLEELDALEAALNTSDGIELSHKFSTIYATYYGAGNLIETVQKLRAAAIDSDGDPDPITFYNNVNKARIGAIQSFLFYIKDKYT